MIDIALEGQNSNKKIVYFENVLGLLYVGILVRSWKEIGRVNTK